VLLLLQDVRQRGLLLWLLLLLGWLWLLAGKELRAHLDLCGELWVVTDYSGPACFCMVKCSEDLIQNFTGIVHLTQFDADGSSTQVKP
jgi:hypothetical protein